MEREFWCLGASCSYQDVRSVLPGGDIGAQEVRLVQSPSIKRISIYRFVIAIFLKFAVTLVIASSTGNLSIELAP
jgi:hypothetical protein